MVSWCSYSGIESAVPLVELAGIAVVQRRLHCASGGWIRTTAGCHNFWAGVKRASQREDDPGDALVGVLPLGRRRRTP